MTEKHYHLTSHLSVEAFNALNKLAKCPNLEVDIEIRGDGMNEIDENIIKNAFINFLLVMKEIQ